MKKIVLCLMMSVALVSLGFAGGAKEADSLAVCLASEPQSLDPALNSAVDGATMIIHAFSGLIGYAPAADGSLKLVADCAKEIPAAVKNADGTVTYTFELKDNLKWSDGSDLTAEDFVYSWNRATDPATAADYGYMFDVIKGYAERTDYEGAEANRPTLDVVADGNKIIVTTIVEVPYFYELLAFPTYMPVKKDILEANVDTWATEPETYISNGAYKMTSWVHNSVITYEKNEYYHDADSITQDKIDFYLSDDATNMLTNFKNGDWKFIDDVPTDEIETLKVDAADEFYITGQLGTYYVTFNMNTNLLPADSTLKGNEKVAAESEIRRALALFFDRNYIVEDIGQAGQVPASSFVAMGLTDVDGKEFYENAGHSDDYVGYYDVAKDAFEANCASAVKTLKKYYDYDAATGMFTNAPSMEYLYNTGDAHKLLGEYLQGALAPYGINLTLTNQEWNTFLETRKNGEFTVARNGWLGDYNDPISFIDMWTTISGNNDAQYGKNAHKDINIYSIDLTPYGGKNVVNGTWSETFDAGIALIKAETNPEKRFALMHLVEDLLMETGALCPLYYYTDIYMSSNTLDNVYSSPLGYKYFMWATDK